MVLISSEDAEVCFWKKFGLLIQINLEKTWIGFSQRRFDLICFEGRFGYDLIQDLLHKEDLQENS